MRRRIRFGRWCFFLLLAGLLTGGLYAAGAQEIDGVSSSVRLERMLLLLQPGAQQQSDLDALLKAQQTPGNAQFHSWITGAEYAKQFAPNQADVTTVATWLKAQGFAVAAPPAGRGWIEFSGTAGQVQKAFGGTLERVVSADSATLLRYRFSSAVTMPAAIAAKVQGLVSLDGALSEPAVTTVAELTSGGTGLKSDALATETSLSKAQALTPSLAGDWLHLTALHAAGSTGTGESIAIPSRSSVRAEDFSAFRKSFGLSDATLLIASAGADPGRTADEAATMQAVSWAGAAAPGAKIILVPAGSTNATDGLDLALAAIVDQGLAHTVSVGYSSCESGLSAAHQAFYATLYRQAAAEGIAIVAATGDSGAAACHRTDDSLPVASGLAVNALAATPWNTAVGAVAFSTDAAGLTGWQPADLADPAYATGGGFSSMYATPAWQTAQGLPASDPGTTAGHHRYLPDISLPTVFAGSSSRGMAFCFSGDSAVSGCRFVSAGGSGISAAIFSGIGAVLAQKYGAQGNLAPNLYAMGLAELSKSGAGSAALVDVASGGAKLACTVGTPNCRAANDGTGEIGFSAASGYDLASGLGSVNAQVLVERWATPNATGTAPASVTMTTASGVTYNPSALINLSAKVISGSGSTVPTGTVQFYDETTSANAGTAVTLTTAGTATWPEQGQFTAGGHNIQAQYSGDTTYAPAVSQPVTINVQPSPTVLVISPSTTTPTGGSTITVTGTVTASNAGATAPSGTLTVNLDGVAAGNALLSTTGTTTSGSVSVTVPTAGSHTLQGIYSGDTNYNAATSPSITIAVAKSATVTTLAATPSVLTTGVAETFTATVAPSTTTTTAYTITGTMSFYDQGTTLLGTAVISSNTAILTGVSLSGTVSHTVTAVYSGDSSYSASTSSPLLLASNLLPVTVTLTESSPVLAPNQPVALSATITPVNTPPTTAEQNPSGYVLFYAGNTLISGQIPVLQGTGDTGIASTTVPRLAAGMYSITAQYLGDPTFGPAVSNALSLQAEDFTVACNAASVSMTQGSTQSVTCNVASLGGLSGPIQVVCAEQNPPTNGAIACMFNPTVITSTGSTTLTIVTTRGNISQNGQPGRSPWPAASGGVALAFAGLLLSPIGRRARRLRRARGRLLGLALLMVGLAGAGLGCTNSVTLASNGGTSLGVHTLQITAGSVVNTVTVTHNAYLTVNVTP